MFREEKSILILDGAIRVRETGIDILGEVKGLSWLNSKEYLDAKKELSEVKKDD